MISWKHLICFCMFGLSITMYLATIHSPFHLKVHAFGRSSPERNNCFFFFQFQISREFPHVKCNKQLHFPVHRVIIVNILLHPCTLLPIAICRIVCGWARHQRAYKEANWLNCVPGVVNWAVKETCQNFFRFYVAIGNTVQEWSNIFIIIRWTGKCICLVVINTENFPGYLKVKHNKY